MFNFLTAFVLLLQVAQVALNLALTLLNATADLPSLLLLLLFLLHLDFIEARGVIDTLRSGPHVHSFLSGLSSLLDSVHFSQDLDQLLLLHFLLLSLFSCKLLSDAFLSLTCSFLSLLQLGFL